jgi:hypothetical protein
MGANARRLAEGTFSRERLAAEFVQNLESVARRTPDDFRSPRAGGTDKTEVQS